MNKPTLSLTKLEVIPDPSEIRKVTIEWEAIIQPYDTHRGCFDHAHAILACKVIRELRDEDKLMVRYDEENQRWLVTGKVMIDVYNSIYDLMTRIKAQKQEYENVFGEIIHEIWKIKTVSDMEV